MIEGYRTFAAVVLPFAVWWGWLAWSRWNTWMRLALDDARKLGRIEGDPVHRAVEEARRRILDEGIANGKVAVVIVRPYEGAIPEGWLRVPGAPEEPAA